MAKNEQLRKINRRAEALAKVSGYIHYYNEALRIYSEKSFTDEERGALECLSFTAEMLERSLKALRAQIKKELGE